MKKSSIYVALVLMAICCLAFQSLAQEDPPDDLFFIYPDDFHGEGEVSVKEGIPPAVGMYSYTMDLAEALHNLPANSKLFIRKGVYPLRSSVLTADGIEIFGEGPASTILDGGNIIGWRMLSSSLYYGEDSSGKSLYRPAHNVTIHNLMMRGGGEGVFLGSGSTVRNCIFMNMSNAISIQGDLYYWDEGGPIQPTEVTIRNNTFYNIGGFAMYIEGNPVYRREEDKNPDATWDADAPIDPDSFPNYEEGILPGPTGNRIVNNIIVDWRWVGITTHQQYAIYNDIWPESWPNYAEYVDPDGNHFNPDDFKPFESTNDDNGTNIFLDPQFVNPEELNFRLQEGSPCLTLGEGGVQMGAYGPGAYVELADLISTLEDAFASALNIEGYELPGDNFSDKISNLLYALISQNHGKTKAVLKILGIQ